MSNRTIYSYTSIARPVDPAYATNKAVLILLPLIAGLCAACAWLGWGALVSPGSATLGGALVAFGAWAVTRELAPDDNPAAFISMALGVVALLAFGEASVLLLFVCLFLVRVVNRSTGKPLTAIDIVMVLGLTLWAWTQLGQPLLPAVAAIAFVMDGLLPAPNRRSLIAAGLCIVVPAADAVMQGLPVLALAPLPAADSLLVGIIMLAWLLAIAMQKHCVSVGDVGGETLSATRVRAGMLVGLLVALQAFVQSAPGGDADIFVWVCLAGALLGRALPRSLFGARA